MNITYYEGRRIYFRPIEPADEPLLRTWINDPQNWRTLARIGPFNELREREYIDGLYKSPDKVALGIVVRDGDRLIGAAGLHDIHPHNHSATFGIVVGDRRYQSRGYGTDATQLMLRYGFNELNLNRIQLTVFASNRRAIGVYRRIGFVQEGCARQAYYRNGVYHDELHFGLLRSEWRDTELADTAAESADSGLSIDTADSFSEEEELVTADEDVPGLSPAAMTMWDTTVKC